MELSILDLDMQAMGNRGRRAMRGLKVRLHSANPETEVGSASDIVLRALGGPRWTGVKSCRVGVPVACSVERRSSTSRATEGAEPGPDIGLTLADMMRMDSGAGSDAGIAGMVARVGRWWFTRCYEVGVLADGNMTESIWWDASLLGECERWGTGLRLLVCYAQKPIVGRRRTASV